MNQNRSARLAAPRTNAARSDRAPAGARNRQLHERVAYVARRLLCSIPNLEADNKQFLWDVERADRLYGMTVFARMMELAQRSVRPEDRELLAEEIRAASLRGETGKDLRLVFDRETEAQGCADMAQRRYEYEPTPANREAVRLALLAQAAATRDALDAVQAGAR